MKANKGITLIPLIILIIIMLILLGISVTVSRDILEKSKAEKLLTYMELIKLRANAYYEELEFEISEEAFESYLVVTKGETLIKQDGKLAKILKENLTEEESKEKTEEEKEEMLKGKIKEKYPNRSYIKWDADKLVKQGIDNTYLEDDKEFFIVAYNYNTHEVENVYYNKGIYLNGSEEPFYSMSDLEKEMSK